MSEKLPKPNIFPIIIIVFFIFVVTLLVLSAIGLAPKSLLLFDNQPVIENFEERIVENNYEKFMQDDFNTQGAIGAIFESIKRFNDKIINKHEYLEYRSLVFRKLIDLGFKCNILEQDEEIEALISKRVENRASKNYIEADKIREELLSRGIVLEEGRVISWSKV